MHRIARLQQHQQQPCWSVDWHPKWPWMLASAGTDRQVAFALRTESTAEWESCFPQPPLPHDQQDDSVMNNDEDNGEETGQVVSHQRTVRTVRFSPGDGRMFATGSFDATCALHSQVLSVNEHENSTNIKPSRRKQLASVGWEQVAVLEGHENEVKSVAWCPVAHSLLATCSRDKSVWIWQVLTQNDMDVDVQCLAVLQQHEQDVKMVKWHPRMELLASCSYDNTIRLWMEEQADEEWYCAQVLTGHEGTVWSVDFDPTGEFLISTGEGGELKIWQNQNASNLSAKPHYECVYTMDTLHQLPAYACSWSPSGNYIATVGGDNCLNIVHADVKNLNFEVVHVEEQAHETDINCVQWSPHVPGLLATGDDAGYVSIWQYIQ